MGRAIEVIHILWRRQLVRYLRSRARIIGSIGQPLLFLIALGFGFGPVFEQAGQGDYLQFLAPGVISMGILFTAIFSGMEVIWDRQFGFLKETLVAPVSRLEMMVGRTLGGATIALIQGALILLLAMAVGFRPEMGTLGLALLFAALIALFFTALGTAIACLIEDMQGFHLIMNLLVMPTFFLSGALFPLANLPAPLAVLTAVNPLSYGVDGLRGSLGGLFHFGAMLDAAVLGGLSILMLAAGAYLFTKIQA